MAQGFLGAPRPKPTSCIESPEASPPFEWALCRELPSRSIGVDQAGKFKIAGLKEYPPAMRVALAQSFLEAILGTQVCSDDNFI